MIFQGNASPYDLKLAAESMQELIKKNKQQMGKAHALRQIQEGVKVTEDIQRT